MSRPPVEARRATVDDLDDLVLLWSQAREELGRSGRLPSVAPLEQFRARLHDTLGGDESIILIGRCEGAAAGYAVLRLAPVLLVDGDALHVEHLFVLPSVRRRGVARALLVAATAIAERHGADQVLAGAPPSARETHRFLARLGFSPLVVRRVVGTAALRRRLAGEGQRRGLDDLISRRRSLRARSLRAGWGTATPSTDTAVDVTLPAATAPDGPAAATVVNLPDGDRPGGDRPGGHLARVDLAPFPDADCPGATAEPPVPGPARGRGRQRA